MVQHFRIKVCTPSNDCHYFYAEGAAAAELVRSNLSAELEGLNCQIYMYVETSYGHIRIA